MDGSTGTGLVFGPQPQGGPQHPDGSPEPGTPPEGPRPRHRLRLAVAVLAALALVAVAVAAPLVSGLVRDEPVDRTLRQVRVVTDIPRSHTPDTVDYRSVPPVGGPHDPAWLECGAYDEPVRDENAVHDLEHGTVWITHDPALPAADVAALERELPDNGILSPYDGLPSPVVVTVWGRQLRLTGADDPRLPLFVARFSDGHTSPEPFASCHGGVTDGGSSGDSQQV